MKTSKVCGQGFLWQEEGVLKGRHSGGRHCTEMTTSDSDDCRRPGKVSRGDVRLPGYVSIHLALHPLGSVGVTGGGGRNWQFGKDRQWEFSVWNLVSIKRV